MRAFIDKLWVQLKEYFGKMERKSRIKMVVLSLTVIALAVTAVVLLSRTNYVVMYNAQDAAEAGNIYNALLEMGVPARVELNTRILVPEERVEELRVRLAADGLLGASDFDRRIMSDAAGFSVTDSHARKLYDAQLESDIRTSILQVPKIQNALVIVSSGETSPFRQATGVRDAHASVMLTIRGGEMLTNSEAQSIAELVRASVPGISYDNISITDSALNHYRIGSGDESMDFETEINSRIALQNLLTEQLRNQAERLLTPIFGMSALQVSVSLRLNFDRVLTESVAFDPPVAGEMDGIVRSSSELWEAQRRADGAVGVPGTDTNAMGTVPEYPWGTLDDDEMYERAVVEKNYEINETRQVIERERGQIEQLSIAVLIDSDAVPEDYTAQVTNLVSMGIGVSEANIAVESVPFSFRDAGLADAYAEWEAYQAQMARRQLIETLIMWAVILALGIMFMLLVRTVVKAVRPEPEPEPVLVGAGVDYIAGDGIDEVVSDLTEYEDVELQTKSIGLEQIERFIDKDAGAVAQLLRNWLTDE